MSKRDTKVCFTEFMKNYVLEDLSLFRPHFFLRMTSFQVQISHQHPEPWKCLYRPSAFLQFLHLRLITVIICLKFSVLLVVSYSQFKYGDAHSHRKRPWPWTKRASPSILGRSRNSIFHDFVTFGGKNICEWKIEGWRASPTCMYSHNVCRIPMNSQKNACLI